MNSFNVESCLLASLVDNKNEIFFGDFQILYIYHHHVLHQVQLQVPNTRHGGTGLYQCKDGFILKGENTTKCDFGNWTGETPICQLVYCPFPGYIVGGKVLLVGNMGLYDYRPYVKKVKNK